MFMCLLNDGFLSLSKRVLFLKVADAIKIIDVSFI